MKSKCVVVASIASRKSVAIAKSIKSLLNVKVVGISHTFHPHIFSRVFDYKYFYRVDRRGVVWPYIVASIAYKNGCEVVVPVDYADFTSFSKYVDMFRELKIAVAAPSYEDIVLASDRVRVVDKLASIAMFPKQVFIDNGHSFEKVYELLPPLVVKDLGEASNSTFHLDYESAAEEVFERAPCIVQEYVEGVARGYYALAFNGEPIIEFTHQRVVEYLPIGGASLYAKGPVKDPLLYAIGRRIVRALNWSGIIMIETRYVDESGTYYVIEINPKFWGSIDLSVTLGYHFPAILVSAYIYGVEKARELAGSLKVSRGEFIWGLDGLRYLVKIPSTWFYMAKNIFMNPLNSDTDFLDPAKNLVQILKAIERFGRESSNWRAYLESARNESRYWIKRFMQFVNSFERVVIFDLDSTLTLLPVQWRSVRARLMRLGLVMEWETINRAMVRLWRTDIEKFKMLSNIIEEEELKSLEKLSENNLYVPRDLLEKLAEETRVCVATKQSFKVAKLVVNKLGIAKYVDNIVGRDGDVGPEKIAMYLKCINGYENAKAVVIDDNIEYVVNAYRKGFTPMLASNNKYKIARVYRLGIPAGSTEKLVSFILHALSSLKQ
ncbi:hypothetical protein QPL79_01235 [Ignisphaera sp. 4213-co]|uniref:ATP-grasp domain-containing protein n=1 Tax=Ignisphaera cupida TaxID=3050454 RepID=A0ABD4Z458_9CREN|nr:hypothetical protein [Ignisphaera sp. 4213-co]MDK6027989.1 hypothetical protein [Ignisphaera sp. 4213-co]